MCIFLSVAAQRKVSGSPVLSAGVHEKLLEALKSLLNKRGTEKPSSRSGHPRAEPLFHQALAFQGLLLQQQKTHGGKTEELQGFMMACGSCVEH